MRERDRDRDSRTQEPCASQYLKMSISAPRNESCDPSDSKQIILYFYKLLSLGGNFSAKCMHKIKQKSKGCVKLYFASLVPWRPHRL